jgi:phosphopantothenoylcysteine decarboxylase/phosphopantothenate--cysteine ligase
LRNPDILAELGEARRGRKPLLVGFAAETPDGDLAALLDAAQGKLKSKRCDLVLANDVTEPGAGFAVDTNRVVLVSAEGGEPETLGPATKDEVAERLWDRVAEMMAHAG